MEWFLKNAQYRIRGVFFLLCMVAMRAYDSRAAGEWYSAELGVPYPVHIDYEASLVSTISIDSSITGGANRQYLQTAAVLTVLNEPPPLPRRFVPA